MSVRWEKGTRKSINPWHCFKRLVNARLLFFGSAKRNTVLLFDTTGSGHATLLNSCTCNPN